jgi:RNA polymerase sigma-70 factor (ECF subfamily)
MSTDSELFSKLFEQHAAAVRKVLHRRGIPRAQEDDLLHDVFVVALKEYDPASPPKPWLLKTAHNVARNWRRRRRELCGAAEAVDNRSPEQCVAELEIHDCIHDVIDTLPEDLRDVFVLKYIEDVPIDEIARTMKVSPTTVQSMLRRAREAFFKEGHRRHAAGELLAVIALPADAGESRLRAGIDECVKLATAAIVGGGLVFALTRSPANPEPIHAEPARVVETHAVPVPVPPVLDLPPSPPIDVVPEPRSAPPPADVAPSPPRPSPNNMDEAVRDELALIDGATWALQRGDHEKARRYLERHKERYRQGRMSALREQLIGQVR